MKKILKDILNFFGFNIVPIKLNDNALEKDFINIYKLCKPFTMTSMERMYALYQAVKYVVQNNLDGDFLECGVWRGGSSMLIAYTLLELNEINRKIYLYDTYTGMPEPTEEDVVLSKNVSAKIEWEKNQKRDVNKWCFSSLEEVKKNMLKTEYPTENIIFVKGKVETTIPKIMPNKIALLRLDTDWYESTKHELKYLYPLLVANGVLIIDDYGHWSGAKKAVDEYFLNNPILLNRIDYTGRIALKTINE